jgi:serine/threonine protein kinase
MTASNGTNFGPYEILALLGAGGMGEVYRARDARLGREVAVKVLPSTFSDNAERLARFEQEACAAGALNHPNILAIYDIGSHEGAPYVVSELLEGETLRDKLDGSPLPQRRAIDYALQIAHGLAAAHEKGIVHRDLKPDNLFVTKDGRVKILDFGLAKLVEPTPLGQVASEAPTRKVKTDSGMVMGTVGYMSPEQVRGQPVDHRSDIFSFGTILYEMLAGKRAFRRESAVETLNAILKEDPPEFSESNEHINPALERIVNHCLEKSPEQRFHSARDLAFALETLSGATSMTSGPTVAVDAPPGSRFTRRELIAWGVAGLTLLAAAVGLLVLWQRPGSDQSPAAISRFQLTPPEKTEFSGPPMISPDGRRLVTRAKDANGNQSLWIRPVDSLDAQPLPGTDNAFQPFWSPDSRMIGFFADQKLKKVDVSGGPVQTLSDAVQTSGGAWSREGVIIFAIQRQGGLFKVPASGGTPTPLTTLDKDRKELLHTWPYFLPDGRHFLYSARSSKIENNGIFVGSLDSNERKAILPGVHSSMAYAPPGYILFVRENALMAQAFDAGKLEATGEAFPVVQKVGFNTTNARAHFSVSETGTLVYRTDIAVGDAQLAWCDRMGKQIAAVGALQIDRQLSVELSPDEKSVAGVLPDQDKPTYNIWLIDLERDGAGSRLTFDSSAAITPIWSPDGSQIAFASTRDGPPNLYVRLSSGAGGDEILVKSDRLAMPNDWSPDGQHLIFQQVKDDTSGMDLWVLPIAERGEPFVYLQTEFAEYSGRFSPDGRWVAYVSNEVGHQEVYVRSFPVSGGKWQVSTSGGGQPRWRADGKELFYISAAGKLMAVDVKSMADSLEFGVPKPLFDVRTTPMPVGFNYDVSRDGQRFLVNVGIDETPPSPLIVVTNWLADRKR